MFGGIFFFASIDKIIHPFAFSKIIYNYKLLPNILIPIFTIAIPWIEFICGIFLILGKFIKKATLILSLLLIIFMIAVLINVIRGIDFFYGCFSVNTNNLKSNGLLIILRDIIILIPGIIILIFGNHKE